MAGIEWRARSYADTPRCFLTNASPLEHYRRIDEPVVDVRAPSGRFGEDSHPDRWRIEILCPPTNADTKGASRAEKSASPFAACIDRRGHDEHRAPLSQRGE